jgi:hypothetical protein
MKEDTGLQQDTIKFAYSSTFNPREQTAENSQGIKGSESNWS